MEGVGGEAAAAQVSGVIPHPGDVKQLRRAVREGLYRHAREPRVAALSVSLGQQQRCCRHCALAEGERCTAEPMARAHSCSAVVAFVRCVYFARRIFSLL
ncbi:hypothetical protein LSCM4_03492 [Leishmania orientalis]|uniref:Uncharacterized protein n=1 Tax=Leishmania orientalis TaxID=2249476 RepID=A0A836H9A9_9TRYP|nr:hypothetical protein LSCM4_03492 [Leishmania orientalis]